MGQICCNDATSVDENAQSDTARLIPPHESAENTVLPRNQSLHENSHGDDYRNMTDNILKETENHMVCANIGDITALDNNQMDERQRFYQSKTRFSGKNLPTYQTLPRANGNPNVILARISLSKADISLIRRIAQDSSAVLGRMLEPDVEDLVVDFAAI